MFTATGKSAIYTLALAFEQWGRFYALCSVVSLALGNCSQVQFIFGADCKFGWKMNIMIVSKMMAMEVVFVWTCGPSCDLCGFYNLTSFYF